jgi:predicted phage terminase large subunit-like protein
MQPSQRLFVPKAEDYAFSRLISYAAIQWPNYRDAAHHRLIARKLEAVERGEIKRLMISVPPRHGKALEVDTPIPTPSGWRRIADLRPGDEVFSETGLPCKVVAVSPVWKGRPVYRVTTDDGDQIIADAEHEWLVRLCRKHRLFKTKTTATLAARKCTRAPMVAQQKPLVLPHKELAIGPYTLGVWLGDGTSLDGCITSHVADQPFVKEQIEAEGMKTSQRVPETLFGVLGLKAKLRGLGLLGDKHIPSDYLFSSKEQRMALLNGLIDTDGHVAPDGQVEFCNKNERLAYQVKELVSSLGVKAQVLRGRATLNGRDFGPKYRVMFYMANAARLPRKAVRCRDAAKSQNRYLQRIEQTGSADTVCIQVDSPSHLFLCGASMLPTHNSMLASEFFPAWYLGRNPDRFVIAATYAQDLADDFGRKVRNQIADPLFRAIFPGVTIQEDSASIKRFHINGPAIGTGAIGTGQGGAYFAVGVGGPLTGRGAHLLIIDDPIKNRDEADSELQRKRVRDWYTSTAYTRLTPNGAVVVIQTRWHFEDLSGWLLNEHAHEGWDVLSLPAINADGDALWPEQYDIKALEGIRRALPVRDWSALYQQQPVPDEGDYFKVSDIMPVLKLPPRDTMRVYGGSDYAVTSNGGDYTVHVVVGVDPDGKLWLLDVWRKQASSDEWVDAFCDLVRKWRPLEWAEETGQIKSGVGPFLDRQMRIKQAFVRRTQFPTRGDKAVRAQSIRGRMALDSLRILADAPYRADIVTEMMRFPAGVHDDFVDALGLVGQLLDRMMSGTAAARGNPLPRSSGYSGFRNEARPTDLLTL